jgi:SagB-type dehydrogenase family enzyme
MELWGWIRGRELKRNDLRLEVFMKLSDRLRMHVLWMIVVLGPLTVCAQKLEPVQLPTPQTEIGRPLMQVLKDRSSTRDFSPRKLPTQVLSNLLWAAFGVNRLDSGKRTAPSAMNWQEIDIYVATPDGLYVYDANRNQLNPVSRDDVRAQTGTQSFVKDAPLDLVYVANLTKTRGNTADRDMYVAADAGFIAQNVYLFCASERLATVVRGSVDRPALSKVMRLGPDQRIILAQTVGYPKT